MAQVSPEQVVSGLVSRGYAPHEAAGIAGNLAQESGFDTAIQEVNPQTESARRQGGGFGLAQWTSKERKQGLYNMAQMRGVPVDDLDLQLDYLDHEFKTTHKKAYKALKSTRDPRHAAWVVSKYYEVPSEKYANNTKRMGLAEQFINLINPIGSAQADETPSQEPDQALMDEYTAWKSSKQPDQALMDEYKAWKEGKHKNQGIVGEWVDRAGKNLKDEVGGLVKGASNIGNTLLSAGDAYNEFVGNKYALSSLDSTGAERREQVDEGLRSMGIDTDSGSYKGGALVSEIAGTSGMGGLLAKGAAEVPYLAKIAPKLATGGMGAGKEGLAGRVAAGAATGAAGSALIDPETTGTGALIGGAFPVIGKLGSVFGKGASQVIQYAKDVYKNLAPPEREALAMQLADMTGKSADDVADILAKDARVAELPGLIRTAPQILQDPNISQVARTVKTDSQMALADAEGAQQKAYKSALESIAPSNYSIADAADKAGSAIEGKVKADYKAATKAVSEKFDDLRSNPERLVNLPLDKLRATVDNYLGRGTVGGTGNAGKALRMAEDLSEVKPVQGQLNDLAATERDLSGKVNFEELQNLRSSIGSLANEVKLTGNSQESAALSGMVKDIDSHLDELANNWKGVTPVWLEKYKEARGLHAAKQERFKTGAQEGMFKPKSNGEMKVEGGEIPGKFYNTKGSQSRDIQSFKRLVNNDASLVKELKEYALTKAGNSATAQGNLGQAYIRWAKAHSGANKELFTKQEMAKINAVGQEIERATKAENLGAVQKTDTAQKLKSLDDLGIAGNAALAATSKRIPFASQYIEGVKKTRGKERSTILAELLADPESFSKTLKSGSEKAKQAAAKAKESALSKAARATRRTRRNIAISRAVPGAAQVLGNKDKRKAQNETR